MPSCSPPSGNLPTHEAGANEPHQGGPHPQSHHLFHCHLPLPDLSKGKSKRFPAIDTSHSVRNLRLCDAPGGVKDGARAILGSWAIPPVLALAAAMLLGVLGLALRPFGLVEMGAFPGSIGERHHHLHRVAADLRAAMGRSSVEKLPPADETHLLACRPF